MLPATAGNLGLGKNLGQRSLRARQSRTWPLPSLPRPGAQPQRVWPVLVACAARRKGKGLPTLKQLREKLAELGLPSRGRKAELLEQLRLAVLRAEEDTVEVLNAEPRRRSKGSGPVEEVEVLKVSGSWTTEGASDPDLVRPGDRIFLRAHTGRFLDVESDHAFARWEDTGDWQSLVIEKNPLVVESSDPTMFQPGDLAFLRAHTGCYLDVQDEGPVKARWVDLGVWQGLELAKREPAPIRVGDTIYLKSHTGMYIDVQGDAVQARWPDQGDWQALTVER
ncbi:unnamed protein product [Effrenium voratum]|uniref:SAP domain-containing protein n=1 Tax=Effrenium voratum TaxID=2562239 RepID=A0AA36MID8_9DINO|nr:unnamed protein product [Effrenium voratum]CAJ1372796.1 unnamed protein product [Effrenium voratum]CAJ1447281.1 unnamed protein product [Effrenium voratum]